MQPPYVEQPPPPPAPAPEPTPEPKKAEKPKPAGLWLALRLGATFGVGGDRPARAMLVSPTGGFDLGYRVNDHVSIGTGISGQIHDKELVPAQDAEKGQSEGFGTMFAWDALNLRFYAGRRGRLQPYLEVGGGMAVYRRPGGSVTPGPMLRAGLGFERWVSEHVTIGIAGTYRLSAFEMKYTKAETEWLMGHGVQAFFDLGFHW
ncbi:MAG: hypothetical protein H6713_06550 [Myxococcales bacterium]|nr:hypothetical protein [Myxococcales bacterium]